MFLFFLKKTLRLLFSLWCVATGTFFLMHAIPGDPFIGDRVIPEEVLRSLYAYYGLDKPLPLQYALYLKELLSGNLGISMVYEGRTVNEFIREGFPVSARLGLQALLVAIPLGTLLGTLAAFWRGKWQDTASMLFATLAISLPNFVLSTLLQYFFAMKIPLFPVALWGTFSHTILPTIALAALPTAYIARLTRSSLVEVLEQDYLKTALAKGLPPLQIACRHALKNALLPALTYLGPVASQLLTGSFMIEKIFAIPGLGQWMILSIHGRDYPMILGLALFFSALLMSAVFVTEILYGVLDPRISWQWKRREV